MKKWVALCTAVAASTLLGAEAGCDNSQSVTNVASVAISLASGLAGSVLTVVLTQLWLGYRHHKEYISLLDGLVAECDYNLSIIDEILEGVTQRQGSFKRLSVDFYRSIREKSVAFSFSNSLLSALSRLIVDMELFNREANYVFDGQMTTNVYAGLFDKSKICITKKPVSTDITGTITAARSGVVASLKHLRQVAQDLKEGRNEDDEQ